MRNIYFYTTNNFGAYNTLILLATNKEILVANVWESSGEDGGWSPCFSRPFNDWEVEDIQRFLQAIQVKSVHPNQEDLMLLKETKDGTFSVKWFNEVLNHSVTILFPHGIIWNTWIPTNVGFFCLGGLQGGSFFFFFFFIGGL